MRVIRSIVVGLAVLLGIAGAVVLLVPAPEVPAPEVPARDLSGLEGDVTRGAYVARLSGCIACHTNAKAGGAVLAGGAKIATEFGVFHAPNITPHPTDGIGAWSLADFSRALTAGESPDGEHYFPAFPYVFYTGLTDQDVVDLWAAVRSVPPVAGRPPPHDLTPPFNWRAGVAIWKRLFFEAGPPDLVGGQAKGSQSEGSQSETWNRGRYLAESAAHCGACHTPRNLMGGRDPARKYQGGRGPDGEAIPPITPDALTRENWDPESLRYALRTGITPSGDVFGGSMAEVVRDGTRFWSDADIKAIVAYVMAPDAGR
jgi:mono/diheme cytochrome c family protein